MTPEFKEQMQRIEEHKKFFDEIIADTKARIERSNEILMRNNIEL